MLETLLIIVLLPTAITIIFYVAMIVFTIMGFLLGAIRDFFLGIIKEIKPKTENSKEEKIISAFIAMMVIIGLIIIIYIANL